MSRGLSVAVALSTAASFAEGAEADPQPEAGAPGVHEDAWRWLSGRGAGGLSSGGPLGTPLFFLGPAGDVSSLLVTLDGVTLNHPGTGGVDGTTVSLGSIESAAFTPGAWRARCRDGALAGSIAFTAKRGRLDVPVSRLAFVQGPRGYKRNAAEFGRSIGASWGAYLSLETRQGTPTPSSVRHRLDQFGASVEGRVAGWYTRISVRRHSGERIWTADENPPGGTVMDESAREITVLGKSRALNSESFSVSLWSRDLSGKEAVSGGRVLGSSQDELSGGLVDAVWTVGKGHRLTVAGEIERRSSTWLSKSSRVEWQGGGWLGDELSRWGGTMRAGIRGDYSQDWGMQSAAELGWSRPAGAGVLDIALHRGFRTPDEAEQRFSEHPPEPTVRHGVRVGYGGGDGGTGAGVRAFLWKETGRAVWRTADLANDTARRWLILEQEIRAGGGVLWGQWRCAEKVRVGGSLAVCRVRDSDGGEVPLSPWARAAFGAEIRHPLPLRDLSAVARLDGRGWGRYGLPEGGEQAAGLEVDILAGFQLSGFRIVGGIRNLFDAPISECPFLVLRERWTGRTEQLECVPRYGSRTERETYFGVSLILYD